MTTKAPRRLVVGIAGAFIGGKLAEVLQVPVFGFWRTLVAAIIGACSTLCFAVNPFIHSIYTADPSARAAEVSAQNQGDCLRQDQE